MSSYLAHSMKWDSFVILAIQSRRISQPISNKSHEIHFNKVSFLNDFAGNFDTLNRLRSSDLNLRKSVATHWLANEWHLNSSNIFRIVNWLHNVGYLRPVCLQSDSFIAGFRHAAVLSRPDRCRIIFTSLRANMELTYPSTRDGFSVYETWVQGVAWRWGVLSPNHRVDGSTTKLHY